MVAMISQKGIGICSDSSGNAYLVYNATIYVYAHGATTPSQTLTLPSQGHSCAVDPLSGNLAVTLEAQASVAVFTQPYNQATQYSVPVLPAFCGYDNAGNLFVDYYAGAPYTYLGLSELPNGGSAFSTLTLSPPSNDSPGAIQWDGQYLTISTGLGELRPAKATIDRVTISNSTATVIGSTVLETRRTTGYPLIYQTQVIMPYVLRQLQMRSIGLWVYPRGGKPERQAKNLVGKFETLSGAAISVAPSE
jgi:hypothetical protein